MTKNKLSQSDDPTPKIYEDTDNEIAFDDTGHDIYRNIGYSNSNKYCQGWWCTASSAGDNGSNLQGANGYLTGCKNTCAQGFESLGQCSTHNNGCDQGRSKSDHGSTWIDGGNYGDSTKWNHNVNKTQCSNESNECWCKYSKSNDRYVCKLPFGKPGYLSKNIQDNLVSNSSGPSTTQKGRPSRQQASTQLGPGKTNKYFYSFTHTPVDTNIPVQSKSDNPMYVWNKCCKTKLGDPDRPLTCPIGYRLLSGYVLRDGNSEDDQTCNVVNNPLNGRGGEYIKPQSKGCEIDPQSKTNTKATPATFSEQCQALMVALPVGEITTGMDPSATETPTISIAKANDFIGNGVGGPCAITRDTDINKFNQTECVQVDNIPTKGWLTSGHNTFLSNPSDTFAANCLAPYSSKDLDANGFPNPTAMPYKNTFLSLKGSCGSTCNKNYQYGKRYSGVKGGSGSTESLCMNPYNNPELVRKFKTRPSLKPNQNIEDLAPVNYCKSKNIVQECTNGKTPDGKTCNRIIDEEGKNFTWWVDENYTTLCGCLYPDKFYEDFKKISLRRLNLEGTKYSWGGAKYCYYDDCSNAAIKDVSDPGAENKCPDQLLQECVNIAKIDTKGSVVGSIKLNQSENCKFFYDRVNNDIFNVIINYFTNNFKIYSKNIESKKKDPKLVLFTIILIVSTVLFIINLIINIILL
jgi:hypothetical protein